MLQRIIEQKTALLTSGAELHTQQYNLADQLVTLLQPFEEATCEVSGEYSSAALICSQLSPAISYHYCKTTTDDHAITSMKREMLASLNQQ